jgi:[ribosomal protein S5]-alanine N-acetyltransferase
MDKKIIISDGEVGLRLLRAADAPRMQKIADNMNVAMNLRDAFPHPYTIHDAGRFIDMVSGWNPPQVFAIVYQHEYVGNIGIHRCSDVYSGSAELGYFIGEPYWNKGITSRAVKLVCRIGFSDPGLIRIHSGVFGFNIASQRVLVKCGFQREGVFRNAVYKNGILTDEIRYALLREDFLNL